MKLERSKALLSKYVKDKGCGKFENCKTRLKKKPNRVLTSQESETQLTWQAVIRSGIHTRVPINRPTPLTSSVTF